jgi:hypothetical protein
MLLDCDHLGYDTCELAEELIHFYTEEKSLELIQAQ